MPPRPTRSDANCRETAGYEFESRRQLSDKDFVTGKGFQSPLPGNRNLSSRAAARPFVNVHISPRRMLPSSTM